MTTITGTQSDDNLRGDRSNWTSFPSTLQLSFGTLSSPIQISDGSVYYLYTVTNRQTLESIFNSGGEVYDTQPNGLVAGVDDARTRVEGDYTIALPTYSEWTNFYYDPALHSAPPPGWATHHYWLAQPNSNASNMGYASVLWYNPNPFGWGPDYDSHYHYAAFQVLSSVSAPSDDTLYGMDGNDLLFGGSGNDELDGGDGIDTADYSNNTASILVQLNSSNWSTVQVGSANEDTIKNIESIIGGSGADMFTGDQNHNYFRGGDGDDLFYQSSLTKGFDNFDGENGIDIVDYSANKIGILANLESGSASARRDGSNYNDKSIYYAAKLSNIEQIYGSLFDDYLFGSSAANLLRGSSGSDVLRGGDGNDQLQGDAGNDTLMGDQGNDELTGGNGKDIFVYASISNGIDVITDFVRGDDKIRLLKGAFSELGEKIYAGNVFNVNRDLTQFTLDSLPGDSNDRLIFNKWNHTLYYDADANGQIAAAAIVELTGINTLSSSDFELC